MNTIDYTLKASKDSHEIGLAIKNCLVITAQQLKDGWQVGTDLPAILAGAFTGLISAIDGVQNVSGEFGEAPVISSIAVLAPVAEGVDEILKILKEKNEQIAQPL